MSESRQWVTLPLESGDLKSVLWDGVMICEGHQRRAIPREVVAGAADSLVLISLEEEDVGVARPSALQVWFWALRGEKLLSLVLLLFLVGYLGVLQGWEIQPVSALLASFGVAALQLAINGLAEVGDWLKLVDLSRWQGTRRERSPLFEGWLLPRNLWRASCCLLGVALACGAPLLWWHLEALLPMAAMGAFAAWGYAQPPLSLKYRGWGESTILLASGPALSLALSWSFFQNWNPAIVSLGFCVGLWNLALHHAGNLVDFDRDRERRATTWVTLLGFRRSKLFLMGLFPVAWLSLLGAVVWADFNPLWFFLAAGALIPQLSFALRVQRASGPASVWLAGVRRRAAHVQIFSLIWLITISAVLSFFLGGIQ